MRTTDINNFMNPKQTVKIFLAEGNPTGLRSVELFNWNGKGFVIPRDRVETAIKRDELKTQGVYILIGESDEGQSQVYIGESENISDRIRSHQKQKDFWETAICFFSKDVNLNKAHVKFLEELLIKETVEAGRAELINGNQPQQTRLSESDEAEVLIFAENIKLVLATIGYTFLKKPTEYEEVNDEIYICTSTQFTGRGIYSSEGMVVLKDSEMSPVGLNETHDSFKNVRDRVLKSGAVTVVEPDKGVFNKDFVFKSPSGAAAIIAGRNINGWTAWKREKDGKTLDEVYRQD